MSEGTKREPPKAMDTTGATRHRGYARGLGLGREIINCYLFPKISIVVPGSPVVRTLNFHCMGCRFNPWSGN